MGIKKLFALMLCVALIVTTFGTSMVFAGEKHLKFEYTTEISKEEVAYIEGKTFKLTYNGDSINVKSQGGHFETDKFSDVTRFQSLHGVTAIATIDGVDYYVTFADKNYGNQQDNGNGTDLYYISSIEPVNPPEQGGGNEGGGEEQPTEAKYTVEHYLQNEVGGTEYTLADTEEFTANVDDTVSATVKNYTTHTFDPTDLRNKDSGIVLEDGSLVLKFYYVKNADTTEPEPVIAKYKVEHYLQNEVGGTEYTLADTEEFTANVDDTVSATVKNYTTHTFDSTDLRNKDNGIVLEDSSLVLKFYYVKNADTTEPGTPVKPAPPTGPVLPPVFTPEPPTVEPEQPLPPEEGVIEEPTEEEPTVEPAPLPKDEGIAEEPVEKAANPDQPKTGDMQNLAGWMSLMLVALAALGITITAKRKED